jgi:hypothetical protein
MLLTCWAAQGVAAGLFEGEREGWWRQLHAKQQNVRSYQCNSGTSKWALSSCYGQKRQSFQTACSVAG